MTIELYTRLSDLNEEELNARFESACKNGDMETVELICRTNLLNFIVFDSYEDDALTIACEHGKYEVVKYLLTNPDLKDKVDINSNNGQPLVQAAKYNHLEIVKFLLTSPELSEHADIHANNDLALRYVCRKGYLNTVKYLLTDPNLKAHANIHAKNDDPFISACGRHQLHVIEYFIFDLNIPKTEYIKNYLDSGFSEFTQHITKIFEQRELNLELQKELASKEKNQRKSKL